MKSAAEDFETATSPVVAAPVKRVNHRKVPSHKTTRDCPRVTVRFSYDDYQQLQELADGAALSVYLRAKALEEILPKRKSRSTASIEDKQAIAQLLGLLGQSRIANNLNQLVYHANIGALQMDEESKTQITEAYEHILFIRQILMKALGHKSA